MTTKPLFSRSVLAAALVSALLAACTPVAQTRGNLISDTAFQQIQPNVSTRADVTQKWGPPTTTSTLDQRTWYFIGEQIEQQGIREPDVKKRRIVRVRFDENDVVSEVADLDPAKSRDIEAVKRSTPTAGKEYTVFQQFVGNLGRFNKSAPNK